MIDECEKKEEHSHWMISFTKPEKYSIITCFKCGASFRGSNQDIFKFCPNCGRKII